MNSLVEEDKLISNPKKKIEKNPNPKLNYFIEKEKLIFLFNFAVISIKLFITYEFISLLDFN